MWKQICILGTLCLAVSGCTVDEPVEVIAPNYLISAYGSGVPTANLPTTDLLDDPENRALLSSCVGGTSRSELARLSIDSLDQRIERLCEGHVLLRDDSVIRPAFPMLTGTARRRLDSIADFIAAPLVEPVRALLNDMRSSEAVIDDNLFHVLWSLVIDQSWYAIWERVCPEKPGPPQAIWIADPPHTYLTGTNFWQLPGGSMVAATWSPRCEGHLERLTSLRLELLRAAWDMPGNDSASEMVLREYGFFGNDGQFAGIAYQDSSSFSNLQSAWIEEYAEATAPLLDLEAAATTLGVSEGQTFVILLHEVAYALFQRLNEGQILQFPSVLLTGTPLDQVAHLVSVRLVRRPLPKDVAIAVFMENGWHGTDAVVPLFRQVLAADPNDLQIRLLLGMALYDLHRYDEAIDEFDNLSERTAADPAERRVFDWSRIWLGHTYDAEGERAMAVQWYQAVADNGSPQSEMSFGQYGIRKISAADWARERLVTPFVWPKP